MSEIWYGYTRAELVDLASDYAFSLGLREKGNELTMKWYYNFMKRWPELKAVKSSRLSELRAMAASPGCIKRYFEELETILVKYDLAGKPHLLYNVDEKGINTRGGKPPHIVTSANKIAQVVTPERSKTVLGCGNAAGSSIPPFLVFPGKRMLPELLKGASPGCNETVTDTGYSNFFHLMFKITL